MCCFFWYEVSFFGHFLGWGTGIMVWVVRRLERVRLYLVTKFCSTCELLKTEPLMQAYKQGYQNEEPYYHWTGVLSFLQEKLWPERLTMNVQKTEMETGYAEHSFNMRHRCLSSHVASPLTCFFSVSENSSYSSKKHWHRTGTHRNWKTMAGQKCLLVL